MRRISYPKAPYAAARRHHSTPIIAVPRTIPRSARPLRRAACPDAIRIASSLFPASLRPFVAPSLRRFVAVPRIPSSLRRCFLSHTNPFAASLTPLTRIPPLKLASFSARRPESAGILAYRKRSIAKNQMQQDDRRVEPALQLTTDN